MIPNAGTYYDPMGGNLMRYQTDAKALYERMELFYRDAGLRAEVGAKGIEEMKQYETARVMPLWDELLGGVL